MREDFSAVVRRVGKWPMPGPSVERSNEMSDEPERIADSGTRSSAVAELSPTTTSRVISSEAEVGRFGNTEETASSVDKRGNEHGVAPRRPSGSALPRGADSTRAERRRKAPFRCLGAGGVLRVAARDEERLERLEQAPGRLGVLAVEERREARRRARRRGRRRGPRPRGGRAGGGRARSRPASRTGEELELGEPEGAVARAVEQRRGRPARARRGGAGVATMLSGT